jgi:integrase
MKNKTLISNLQNIQLRRKKLENCFHLYLDYHYKGKRYREFLKLYISLNKTLSQDEKLTLRLAEKLLAKKKLELQSNFHDEPNFNPTNWELTTFIDHLIANSPTLRPSSLKKYKSIKEHIKDYDDSPVNFSDIDKKWIEGLKNFLFVKFKRSTADRYFSGFITILNNAVKDNIIKYNPSNGIKRIGRDRSLPKFLTLDEVKMLSQTPIRNNDIRLGFLFSCFTSLRLSDIKSLTWQNIYENDGKIYVKFTQMKTSVEENNPLSPQALFYLGDRGEPDELVFKLPKDPNIDKSIKAWGKRAGLSQIISFHWARHTFGTLSVQSGIDLYTTSKMMGHSSIRHTEGYARVINPMKEKAITLLPTFEDKLIRKYSDKKKSIKKIK